MDILDFLTRNRANPFIGYGLAIVGIVLIWVGRGIYFALFPSKRNWKLTKSFDEEAKEYQNQPLSDSPESIGSLSVRLGEDIRDVWEMGYSHNQVNGVLTGKYTLEEMYKMEPEGNTVSSKGKEILGDKELLTK